MKITRTYPQPDSPKPHLGARERAMAVYKYLLGLEPEAAIKHERFATIVHAFEQAGRKAVNTHVGGEVMVLDKSYCDELSSTQEAELRPLPQAGDFKPDGI